MEDLPFDINGNEALIIPKEVDLLAQRLGANDGLWRVDILTKSISRKQVLVGPCAFVSIVHSRGFHCSQVTLKNRFRQFLVFA